MTTEDRIRSFILTDLRWPGPAEELDSEYPLIERDVLDSLGIFHMVSFLEREFRVQIEDEELVPEVFGTIRGIARLVDSKSGR
jgi:acyl carrier protein